MKPITVDTFFSILEHHLVSSTLARGVLGNRRNKEDDLQKILFSPVRLRQGVRIKCVYRYATRDITRNFTNDEVLSVIRQELETRFFNADIFALDETIQLSVSPAGKVNIRRSPVKVTTGISLEHDHHKERFIETAGNLYLRELGVVNAAGEVRREKADKFIQINRYIELTGPVITSLNKDRELHIADMGAGKGYLTFALFDYLTKKSGLQVKMTGVESRKELVDQCNDIAERAGFSDLTFTVGTIRDAAPDRMDVLIALHACDTATDDAIAMGISAGAQLIVCAPCCHKQVRKAMTITADTAPVLRHGILAERQAEILTDALRALFLEANGYQTRVFEFTATEHTPKNLMITARKVNRNAKERQKFLEEANSIKTLFGISHHYLETLLNHSNV